MINNEFRPETLEYMNQVNLEYRKSLGQYFTPRSTREKLLSKLPLKGNPKILDLGCGTGEFLLTAKEYFENPELYGWDIDEIPRQPPITEKTLAFYLRPYNLFIGCQV